MEKYFVDKDSIVRLIWGNADSCLFIFAGAAAEFSLNKAVDWLYFTGKLPADPLGRLFSTVAYAHRIIFSENETAINAVDHIAAIHKEVENKRAQTIPEEAYRDVLFLLVDYSIRSFELLERKMSIDEKRDIFDVFNRVGIRMKLKNLPSNYEGWLKMRNTHLRQNLVKSNFTFDLYKQYEKHLGKIRYIILKQVQWLLVPNLVKKLLPFKAIAWIAPFLWTYKLLRLLKIEKPFKNALLPKAYKSQISALNVNNKSGLNY